MKKEFIIGFLCGAVIFAAIGKTDSIQQRRINTSYLQQLNDCRESEEKSRVLMEDLYMNCDCELN